MSIAKGDRIDKHRDDTAAPAVGSEVEGRHFIGPGSVNVNAFLAQRQLDHCRVTVICGGCERRPAVGDPPRVNVDHSRREQRADDFVVAFAGCHYSADTPRSSLVSASTVSWWPL
jgi:hypothetical protein